MSKQIVYVSGLPRSGSTLLCQLLGEHPEIYSTAHSSPLCAQIERTRQGLSHDAFMLSQLDVDFDTGYSRIKRSLKAFMDAWHDETDLPVAVDKSRQWLPEIETLMDLDPDFKMVICIRDLVDVFASVEKKHRKTILMSFPDNMAPGNIEVRCKTLFAPQGIIGGPISAIKNLGDVTNQFIADHIYFVAYEALIEQPVKTMRGIYEWIGVDRFNIDPDNLTVNPHESDSYYHFKYPHKTYDKIFKNTKYEVSQRMINLIIKEHMWYYQMYYPITAKEFTQGQK